jgi:RNA polymerase-binding transcription factor DksA
MGKSLKDASEIRAARLGRQAINSTGPGLGHWSGESASFSGQGHFGRDALNPISDGIKPRGTTDMATGWAPDGAVQDQIDDTVMDGVLRARASMPVGMSQTHCDECGEEISEARRLAIRGVRTCVPCQSERDRRPMSFGINRRGSKDSQLK